jgi:DNA-directed RNA polymerase subunit F
MKSKNTEEIYNRLSFRSPLRRTHVIKSQKTEPPDKNEEIKTLPQSLPIHVNTHGNNLTSNTHGVSINKNDNNVKPIHNVQNIITSIHINNNTPIIVKSKMHDRVSCRSPANKIKRDKKEEPSIYNIITKTPSGDQVNVPTEDKCSFIKFKENTITLAQPVKVNNVIELMSMKRCKFENALLIYENNQSYYLEQIKKEKDEEIVQEIIKKIEHLEKWFCKINEPKPKNEDDLKDWKLRNQFKKDNGYSKYFDLELLPYTNYN